MKRQGLDGYWNEMITKEEKRIQSSTSYHLHDKRVNDKAMFLHTTCLTKESDMDGCVSSFEVRTQDEGEDEDQKTNAAGAQLRKAAEQRIYGNSRFKVEENLHARTVIINRAHKLNALSSQMVSRLHEVFIAFEKDPEVKFLTLMGKGKAFCVGGDVGEIIKTSMEGN
ncbi:hypothetical protein C5167_030288 [Papaver somniferum]|nr:hypothetical protein C5167_030288 [Papaver somniferum]